MKIAASTLSQIVMLIFILSTNVSAHPYFDLTPGNTTTFDYSFEVITSKEEFKQSNTKGKIKTQASEWVEKDGQRYLKYVTTYDGISFMTQAVELWRREDNGILYIASIINNKLSETIELPANVTLNSEWDYFDGEKSKRKVTQILDLEFNGQTYKDCLEVTRVVLNSDRFKSVTNKNYYCPKIGDVKSIFSMPSPVGDYVTSTSLASLSEGQ